MKVLIIRLLRTLKIILPYGDNHYRFNLLNPFGYVVLIIVAIISSVYDAIKFIYMTLAEAIKVEKDLASIVKPSAPTPAKSAETTPKTA